MSVTSFPTIVKFLGTDDAGEGAVCPHCGAPGRYITRFVVADGRTLGAMRGCAKLFPVSPLAREQAQLLAKKERYRKKQWTLNRRDQQALDLLEEAIAGRVEEHIALSMARSAKAAGAWQGKR